jgi:hypothetical protein
MSHYLTRKEAAEFLKHRYRRGSYSWLTRLAADGSGPRQQRFGSKAVLYAEADLIAWAEQNIRASGSQPVDCADQNGGPEPFGNPKDSAVHITPAPGVDDPVARAFAVMRDLRL